MKHYPEYEKLDLPELAEAVRQQWEANDTFNQSISHREGAPPFVFYEGPPSANGLPGIHHVMSRTIKDLFCRYKTQKGFQVQRKAGWDTHGLPVELAVEKALGITKEDIGTKISIAEYNQECRKAVMRFTEEWNAVTRKMGYWVNMDAPYVTYHNQYIETVWWLLQQLHKKDLLYKGYSIQPYSPKAGTGLSSHELNLPGCYRDVKDQSAIAQFSVVANDRSAALFGDVPVHLIAWTTTPWTLPSNTALAVGPKITYVLVRSFNQYSHQPINVILAKDLLAKHFKPELADLPLDSYEAGSKKIPYEVVREFTGTELVGLRYEQLLPYVQPMDNPEAAFQVIPYRLPWSQSLP
ncbi:MAG: class I tRNA ligase family protein, partial [Bacteroidota bacterium]